MVESEAQQRSSVVAAVLSALLPGAGHIYARDTRRGLWLLGLDAFLMLIAVLVAFDSQVRLRLVLTVAGVGAGLFANVLLLAFRIWAADDAVRRMGRRRPVAVGAFVGGAVMVLVIVGIPHLFVARYSLVTYQALDIFADDDVAASTTTTTAPPDDDEPATPGETTTTTEGVPPVEGPPIWDGLERLNILLLGADVGPDRRGVRTDTMIVVSIDPVTGDTAMFSIPRNTVRTPLPDGFGNWDCQCFPQLLNDLYNVGLNRPDLFPGPQDGAVNAIKGGIGELLDLEIHYYAMVDLFGFIGVIDALGGVEVDVQFRIVDETYPHEDGETIESIVIEPGRQKFDGHLALAYSRIRRHADDYARMQRQRCVLEGVVEQSNPAELALAYPRLVGVLSDSLQTDIPRSRLVDFVELAQKIDTDDIVAIRYIPPTYISGSNDFGNIPDVELIQEHTRLATTLDPASVIDQLGLESLDGSCA